MHRIIPHRPSIVLLAADVGIGKTTLLTGLAARVSQTEKVAYFFSEGSERHDIRPMLKAAGAHMNKVSLIDCVTNEDRSEWGLKDIARHIESALPDTKFFFIDTLTGFENADCKMRAVRRHLAPYQRMVERGVTVFIAHHTTKARKAHNALDMLAGSKGWPGAVQVVWQIVAMDELGHGVLQKTRDRHSAKPWPGFEFWTEGSEEDPSIPVAVIGDESELSIESLLAQKRPSQLPPALAKAIAWFDERLRDGPCDALPDSEETYASISITRATFKKAKHLAKVRSRPKPQGRGYEWYREESESQSHSP